MNKLDALKQFQLDKFEYVFCDLCQTFCSCFYFRFGCQFVNVTEEKSSMASCSVSTMVLSTTLALSLSWLFLLAFYTATSTHSFTSLTHLPNSRGEVCGEGAKNKERENLLYFDISKCAGLRADNETCRSKQVGISSAEVTIFYFFSPDLCN